jgi:AMMECR1 domain-containing protein
LSQFIKVAAREELPLFLQHSLSHFLQSGRFLRNYPMSSRLEKCLWEESKGLFVTVYLNNEMCGCSGSPARRRNLFRDLQLNAVRATFFDKRFPPIRAEKIRDLEFSVVELGEMIVTRIETQSNFFSQLEDLERGIVLRYNGKGTALLPNKMKELGSVDAIFTYLLSKAGIAEINDFQLVQLTRFECKTIL